MSQPTLDPDLFPATDSPAGDPPTGLASAVTTLRLIWPQWQGAGTSGVKELAPRFPFDMTRRAYQTFVGEYGWSPEKWGTWCAGAIRAQLF